MGFATKELCRGRAKLVNKAAKKLKELREGKTGKAPPNVDLGLAPPNLDLIFDPIIG